MNPNNGEGTSQVGLRMPSIEKRNEKQALRARLRNHVRSARGSVFPIGKEVKKEIAIKANRAQGKGMKTFHRLAATCFFGILIVSYTPAMAALSLSAQVSAYENLNDGATNSTPVSKSIGLDHVPIGDSPFGTLTTLGTATGDRGLLHSSGRTQLSDAYLGIGHIVFYGNGNATFSFDDLLVTATSNPNPQTTVPISLNMLVGGSFSTSIGLNNPQQSGGGAARAHVHLQINITLNGNNYIGALDDDSNVDGSGNVTRSSSTFGLLSTYAPNGPVSLDGVLVPVNTPFSLSVNFASSSSIEVLGSNGPQTANFSGLAVADYSLELAPQFTLPSGYTINSPEAGIVDNLFTPPNQVPEPGTTSLGSLCLGAAIAAHRRRRSDPTA